MMKIISQKSLAKLSLLITAVLVHNSSAYAQSSLTNAQTFSRDNVQKQIIQVGTPTVRTSEEMERDNARATHSTPVAIPFRPTIDRATYQRLKDEAQAQRGVSRSGSSHDSRSNHE